MKTILVTGGLGYIGSHTIVELYKSGYIPIIIDNLCNTSLDNLHGIEKIVGTKIKWYNIDCTDRYAMENIFNIEKKIVGAIHFAAYKSVEESSRNPKKYYDNNIGSLKVLLSCLRNNNILNIIFSSSCTVYGMPDVLPVSELSPFKKAESPYGETKQLCEEMILEENINSISLRYFNPIGSHETALIGDCSSDKPSNLVPIITETAIGKRKKITIYGNDYNTPDGTCIRDYIHVVDLAKSHVMAIKYLFNNPGKHIFNVGTGIGLSVLEVINKFARINKLKINYSIGDRRNGDIERIYSNCDLIKKELGWSAEETFKQAMISSWKWEKQKNKNV
ncbi:UDP-glucose 4-epimerase GalE [bacterium]|nr:UDP-glucose 4-epimerase GalE [bacterium]